MKETIYWIFYTYIMHNLYYILIIYHYNILTYKSRLLPTPPSAIYKSLPPSCSQVSTNVWLICSAFLLHIEAIKFLELTIIKYILELLEFRGIPNEVMMNNICIWYMIPHRGCIITMDSIWVSFVFSFGFSCEKPASRLLPSFLSFFCFLPPKRCQKRAQENSKGGREREKTRKQNKNWNFSITRRWGGLFLLLFI